uniref:Rap guanine nucleotide exchange factor like 1 n=1 Tax=Anas platyrhynchos platyrhynchos TaxID=8840 RepID=U3ISR1_ANAPP
MGRAPGGPGSWRSCSPSGGGALGMRGPRPRFTSGGPGGWGGWRWGRPRGAGRGSGAVAKGRGGGGVAGASGVPSVPSVPGGPMGAPCQNPLPGATRGPPGTVAVPPASVSPCGFFWGGGCPPLTPSPCPPDSLLDDIVLTHSLFLPTERFLQQLHQQYPWGGGDEGAGLRRKRAVLAVLLHFLETYKGLLQEEESAGKVIKELYLLIMKDTALYHELEDDILKLHQLVETVELKVADETPPPSKQVKPLFRHFRRIDSCLQTRVAFRGSDEIFCRVYMPDHSYVTIRSRLSASVQDILASVTEKLQYSEEQGAREDALVLVTVASSGEKAVLQPSEECVFTTLGINSHLFACTRDAFDSLVPLPEEIPVVPGDTEIHRVEPEDIANHLTAFHWELFRCIHELEFVDYVFHGERGRRETANLELLLQRCSEVQHWVGTELLLCESLGKRAHLLKKLIKIAAICKQNQDMLSFYAVVIGLNNAAISRLRLTWE